MLKKEFDPIALAISFTLKVLSPWGSDASNFPSDLPYLAGTMLGVSRIKVILLLKILFFPVRRCSK